MPDDRRPYTTKDVLFVKKNASRGAESLAAELQRSVTSIRKLASRERISLRRAGERRGLLIGQPRGTSWMDLRLGGVSAERLAEIRSEALSGELDLAALERAVVDIARGKKRLCPNCTARYVDNASSGFCTPCHLRTLASLHRDEIARRSAQRELWAAKQESSRLKRGNESLELSDVYSSSVEDLED